MATTVRQYWNGLAWMEEESKGAGSTVPEMHGHSVASAAQDMTVTRTLDVVEFFCGTGSIFGAAQREGFNAAGYDKNRVPGHTDQPGTQCEDITTADGFHNALRLAKQVRVGGLIWLAPECNSFNWLCVHQSQRRAGNGWAGDEQRQFVANGNKIAKAAAFLAYVAHERGVHFGLENGPKSYLWKYIQYWHPEAELFVAVCDRCAFNGCWSLREALARPGMPADDSEAGSSADGECVELKKQYRILGNAPWVHQLGMLCQCPPEVEHVSLTKSAHGKRYGKMPVLKASAAYKPEMGWAVVEAWCSSQLVSPGSTGVSLGSTGVSWSMQSRPPSTQYTVADGALTATARDRSRSPLGNVKEDGASLLGDDSDDAALLGDDWASPSSTGVSPGSTGVSWSMQSGPPKDRPRSPLGDVMEDSASLLGDASDDAAWMGDDWVSPGSTGVSWSMQFGPPKDQSRSPLGYGKEDGASLLGDDVGDAALLGDSEPLFLDDELLEAWGDLPGWLVD
jgi:hypothetical protein